MKKFLVSTAECRAYDQDDNLLFTGTTLLDTSIDTSLSNTDVRAGIGNQLQYVYYHKAEMNINLNEAQFSLPFLALNVGSEIETGAKIWNTETVTLTNGNGSVTEGTPLVVQGTTIYGWVTYADNTVERVTFTGKNFGVSDKTFSGTVCVRYYTQDSANALSSRKITINADMLPSTVYLVMEAQLCSADATTNRIGTIQVEVPRASMTGSFTLNMTPDSVAQTPLTVRALASTVNAGGCTANRPIYATVTETIFGAKWYDGVIALAIAGGDFDLGKNNSKQLEVYAMKNDGSAPFLVPMAELTFASSNPEVATAEGGLVVAKANGTTTVKATITANVNIDANVVVNVPAA